MAATDFETAVSQAITSSNQLHDVINGTSIETVDTDSGEIPTIRKAIADSSFFIAPIPWDDGVDETNLFQTRSFESGTYWAPAATTVNPVPMGSTPIGDDNWFLAPVSLTEDFVRDVSSKTFPYKGAVYKGIGNISDYVGDSLPETDKLNSYQYPSDSGNWYGTIQSQTFPVTIPADPSNDDKWTVVSAITGEMEEFLLHSPTLLHAQSRKDIKAGYVFSVTEHSTGTSGKAQWVCITKGTTPGLNLPNGSYIVDTSPVSDFALRIVNEGSINPRQLGARGDGSTDDTDAIQSAITYATNNNVAMMFPPGTYLITGSVTADNFDRLTIFATLGSVVIDFQTSQPFKFGDFSTTVEGYANQRSITCGNIEISGLIFKPVSGNGWDGSEFEFANCISLSSCSDVNIHDCEFHDQHVAAIDFFAPSRRIWVQNNKFFSSEDASFTYAFRPFCYVGELINFDATTGLLTYPAPTDFHSDIWFTDNVCENIGRAVISWNCHNSNYLNNIFRNPVTRTISLTNWNFNALCEGNTHIVGNKSSSTLSTCVNIGTGSERITLRGERFVGEMSGIAPNGSLKCVDMGGANNRIRIEYCDFYVVNAAVHINCGANTSFEAIGNRHTENCLTSCFLLIDTPAASPSYTQGDYEITDSYFNNNDRYIIVNGKNAGGDGAVRFRRNNVANSPATGILSIGAEGEGWNLFFSENSIKEGAFGYFTDAGVNTKLKQIDRFDRRLSNISTRAADNITLNYREYLGEFWFVAPDGGVALTIDGITNSLGDGQRITIMSGASSGGSVTIPYGSDFRPNGGVDAVLVSNESITLIQRSGIWFEEGRS